MNSATHSLLVVALLAGSWAPTTFGEESSVPTLDSLRIQIAVARYRGQEKISSVPYTMLMSVGDEEARSLVRMGVEVPVPTSRIAHTPPPAGADVATPTGATSFSYRQVGTDIDCRAERVGDRYRLALTLEHSSVLNETVAGSPGTSLAPMFNTFRASLNPILSDGETTTVVASTDPVTGQVVRIEVTLSVLR